MKKNHLFIALIACGAMLVSSCHHHHSPYYSGSVSIGYNSGYSDAWVSASYDSNGFPIYGYSYGRPVYGYTADGLAVFSFAALTAACFVPLWKPAPWYRGHWHYPRHIHRVARPHRCPAGHFPGKRPSGGLHAPIHKNPHSVLNKHHGIKPGKPAVNRPPHHFSPGKPTLNKPTNHFRPAKPNVNRPGNIHRPSTNRPHTIKPSGAFKPSHSNHHTRPNVAHMKRPTGAAPMRPSRSNFRSPRANSHPTFSRGGAHHRGPRGGRR